MSKTAYINSRIDPDIKSDAEAVFKQIGISTSEAINLFFHHVSLHQGLPFSPRIPNQETIDAINEPLDNLASYSSGEELLNDILGESWK